MPVFVRWLTLIGLCLLIGCSKTEPVEDTGDSDQIMTVLKTSLDAWRDGASDSLVQREPPIRFVDDDCAAGRRLVAYRLEDPELFALPFESVYVNLTLQGANGKTVERMVGYQISLTPSLAVLRSEP